MDALLAHSLVVVTGKGGVGKSTVATALGIAAARRGARTIVVEVAARGDVPRALGSSDSPGAHGERAVADRLDHISIDPQGAMEDYLRQQLPVGALAPLLSRSRIFAALTAATPGMRELLTIGKVWELARQDRGPRGARPYDLVVLDAPATGHGLAMLQAPRTFASVARVGPVAKQGRAIASFLGDPRRTAVVAVSTAEEMPVTETIELRRALREQMGLDLALIVVNAVVPHRFSERDRRTLRAAPPSPARHAALFSATWSHHQRAQIARLRRGLRDVASVTFPFVFGSALGWEALERLSRELES
jgi:anion-transporting  ArsA/GET3 family ATPase